MSTINVTNLKGRGGASPVLDGGCVARAARVLAARAQALHLALDVDELDRVPRPEHDVGPVVAHGSDHATSRLILCSPSTT